jgi:hypothetical protein
VNELEVPISNHHIGNNRRHKNVYKIAVYGLSMNYRSTFTSFPKGDGNGVLRYPQIAFSCTTFGRSYLDQIIYPLDSIVKVIDLTNVIYEATKAINQIAVSIYTSILKISKLTKVLRKFSIK